MPMESARVAETPAGGNLLHKAVHQHRAISKGGMQERLFTALFSGLVYPQIWEDPDIDLEALDVQPDSHIVTIASGGCNVMCYLLADPRRITAVDLNPAHVALTRLKLAAAAHLPSYERFRRFFAQANHPGNIDAYKGFLKHRLDDETAAYWEKRSLLGRKRISLFRRNIYRHGLLGNFIGASHVAAKALGVDLKAFTRCRTLEEQRAFFEREIAPQFEKRLVRWVTRQPASLFGLGIPPAQFAALSGGRAMHLVLRERLERLVCDFPVQENYFAWQAFNRHYANDDDGPLPAYLQRQHFNALNARHDRVMVLNRSFSEFLRHEPEASADRYVLLDAQDWMTDAQLNDLWAEITRTARPGARVIFRTADTPSLLPGRLAPALLERWTYHEAESAQWTKRDRSSIYGGFHLYSLKSA
ncbi:MAG: DUF3419 family protein [Parvibaculaceae bacterium]|nr:DUF3419 family protein [Parvibaculaceae bacterium]